MAAVHMYLDSNRAQMYTLRVKHPRKQLYPWCSHTVITPTHPLKVRYSPMVWVARQGSEKPSSQLKATWLSTQELRWAAQGAWDPVTGLHRGDPIQGTGPEYSFHYVSITYIMLQCSLKRLHYRKGHFRTRGWTWSQESILCWSTGLFIGDGASPSAAFIHPPLPEKLGPSLHTRTPRNSPPASTVSLQSILKVRPQSWLKPVTSSPTGTPCRLSAGGNR